MFSSELIAKMRAIYRNGTNDQKTQRQLLIPKINPVKVGPIAGANIITKAHIPMTAPIFWGGKISNATVNMSGRISPVPIPWIIGPINTIRNPFPIAETMAPNVKAHRPKITICRVVNHFVSKLDSGKTTPITNM